MFTLPTVLHISNEKSSPPSPLLGPPLLIEELQIYNTYSLIRIRPRELRIVVYKGGVEPQLRKVAWKHLLGVYPPGLDGRQRLDYMRQKSVEYDKLKNNWIQVLKSKKNLPTYIQCKICNT